jgi:hypothetical protein
MKQLYWTLVPDQAVEQSVWRELKDERAQIDANEFETLFCQVRARRCDAMRCGCGAERLCAEACRDQHARLGGREASGDQGCSRRPSLSLLRARSLGVPAFADGMCAHRSSCT